MRDGKHLKGKSVLKKPTTSKRVTQVEKSQEVIFIDNDVSMANESAAWCFGN